MQPEKSLSRCLNLGPGLESGDREDLLGVPLDSGGLLQVLRRAHPQCVSVVNANALIVEDRGERLRGPSLVPGQPAGSTT